MLGFATLSDVQQSASGEVILMTLLGGTGTFFGPVVGAAIVVTLQEYLSDVVGGWVTAIIGVIFVACVLSFRRGIVGELEALRAAPHAAGAARAQPTRPEGAAGSLPDCAQLWHVAAPYMIWRPVQPARPLDELIDAARCEQ